MGRVRTWLQRPVDLNEVRYGVSRWRLVFGAFLLMVGGQIVGFWLMQQNYDHDRRLDAAEAEEEQLEQIQLDYEGCLHTNETRELLRQVIELSPTNGGSLNLTQVAGFENLDPDMQTYLRNLEEGSERNPDDPTFRDLALEVVETQRDCEAEYPEANHK